MDSTEGGTLPDAKGISTNKEQLAATGKVEQKQTIKKNTRLDESLTLSHTEGWNSFAFQMKPGASAHTRKSIQVRCFVSLQRL